MITILTFNELSFYFQLFNELTFYFQLFIKLKKILLKYKLKWLARIFYKRLSQSTSYV